MRNSSKPFADRSSRRGSNDIFARMIAERAQAPLGTGGGEEPRRAAGISAPARWSGAPDGTRCSCATGVWRHNALYKK